MTDSLKLSNNVVKLSSQLTTVSSCLLLSDPSLPHTNIVPSLFHHLSSIASYSSPRPFPFTILIAKAGQSFLAFQRYKLGADSALFSQDYTDPSQDAAGAPYTSFGGDDLESPGGGGGQTNSDGAFDGSGGYQRQEY